MATTCSFGQPKDARVTSLCVGGKEVLDKKRNLKNIPVANIKKINAKKACINDLQVEIVDDFQLYDMQIVKRPIFDVIDFTGEYAPENWVIDENGGNVAFQGNSSIILVSSDSSNIFPGNTVSSTACITNTITDDTNIYFNWNYVSHDVNGPMFDPFGVTVNGDFTQISDDQGANVQYGCHSMGVTSDFTFCFSQISTDQILGNATVTLTNFRVGKKSKLVGRKYTVA